MSVETEEAAVTDEAYFRLQRHLDTFLMRAPESEAILEILRIRFTPQEAEVALLLRQTPEDVPTLARSAGMDEDGLRSILEQMADKALVFKQTQNRDNTFREVYSLLPTAVGLWETSFAKGERNPRAERLARYWREYYRSGWGKAMFPSKTPFTRIIPVRQSIQEQQETYPHEQAAELIKQQDYACVLHCACRMAAKLDGKGCGRPTEVCMHFGDLAKFFVENGYAREINLGEALEILDASAEAGLIHMVANSKQMGVALCSCCSCCCTQMRAIAEMNIAEPIARSRFVAQVDDETCTACGDCEERCLVEAISVVDETAEVASARCIGCGLCVTDCPEDAVSLGEREGYQEPAETLPELIQAFMKDAV